MYQLHSGGLIILAWIGTVGAQYTLWPYGVDAVSLAASIGVSTTCLAALNETVACNSILFKRTKSPDAFLWSADNITDLCTSDCNESATSWGNYVESACANETIFYNNMAVPADTISGRHVEGLNLACMTNSVGNSCLVESQDWVGSGMIYNADGTLSEDQSFTRLYDNATLCDDCFVNMLVARLNSSFLAESEHNLYLTAELGTVLDWCDLDTNITLQPYATYTSSLIPATSASSASASAATPTCTGQVIDADTVARLAKRQLLSGVFANSNISQACLDYSLEYEVPTGSLVIASGDSTCANITSGMCLPGACDLAQVTSAETTCDLLATGLTVVGESVSLVQLLYWNPTIIGTCDNLEVGQYVCVSPPGGAWTPAIANITSAAGDGGGVTATFVSGATTSTPTNGIATPTPIQTGMTTSCDVFYAVRSDDTCDSVATEYDITLDELYAWNPAVGTDCLSLELGVYVCVDILGSSTASAASTSASNTFSTPSPVQTGIASNCDDFHLVVSDDTCQAVADEYDITLAQIYAWNPAVGSDCEDLELGTYVCVAVAIVVSTPSPVQTGMSSSCDEFHYVVEDDTCQDVADEYGITLAQLYAWNPAIGSECQYLELDTYVCVLIEGVTASPTGVAPVTTPSPVQTGMATDCDAFYYVTSGDGCAAIASKEDIATASFYAWNPAVGTDCADLYLDYYVCIGVETTAVAARSNVQPTEAGSGAAESEAARRMALPLITPAPRRPGIIA